MAHLQKLPTYFVKDGERKAAFYTIQARELKEAGWVEEGEKAVAAKPAPRLPEIVVEAGAEPFDSTDSMTEPLAEDNDLDGMTKADLLDWAEEKGHEIAYNTLKADILAQCKRIQESL